VSQLGPLDSACKIKWFGRDGESLLLLVLQGWSWFLDGEVMKGLGGLKGMK